jgi:hypothetical protein
MSAGTACGGDARGPVCSQKPRRRPLVPQDRPGGAVRVVWVNPQLQHEPKHALNVVPGQLYFPDPITEHVYATTLPYRER